MNYAIIFIKSDEEKQLIKTPYRGSNVLLHQINQLKKANVSKVYVAGIYSEIPGAITRDSIKSIVKELPTDGKCLLVSPLYPALDKNDYLRLLECEKPAVLVQDKQMCGAFMIPNSLLYKFESLNYEQIEVTNKKVTKFTKEDAQKFKQSSLNDVVVFSLTSNKELVNEICGYLNIEPGNVIINQFADGETLVELGESVRGKRIYVIQSTCQPVNDKLMELLISLDALKRSSAGEITCIIPYFGYARQDRKASPRQPISAKLVAKLLEASGADRVVTFDLHAAQIQGFFDCPVDDLTAGPMIGQYFANKNLDRDNLVVVSPDHGGVKRARNLAEILQIPIAIIDKRRPRANVCEATTIIGDVKGKDAIIIDDICDTGGSLIAACNMLKDNGTKSVSIAITHGIFSKGALQKFEENDVIKEIIVTNTIPVKKEDLEKYPKLKVLSIAWMLSKLILAVSGHTPVSEVYALYETK